jgi:hypothetical protein
MISNNQKRMKAISILLLIGGMAYAAHGFYGLAYGIARSRSNFDRESQEIIGQSKKPDDAYGKFLYEEIARLPSNAENSMRLVAIIQVGTGIGASLVGLAILVSKRRRIRE